MRKIFWMTVLLFTAGAVFAETNTNAAANQAKIPKKGIRIKPFPQPNYNADLGLGLGVSITLLGYDGKKEGYNYKIYTEYMGYTGGQIYFDVRFDIPDIRIGTQPFRITGIAEYKQARYQPYYGTNNSDAKNHYFTDSRGNPITNKYYYQYNMINPYAYFTLTTPLVWGRQKGFDKEIGLAFGAYLESYSFTNSFTNDAAHNPVYLPSKLMVDRPYGVKGGTVFSVSMGINFDSRDYIPNPKKGTYDELMYEVSLANSYQYSRLTALHQAYFLLLQGAKTHLIFAERVWIDNLFGRPPFFKQGKLGGFRYVDAFGGGDSMRGRSAFRGIGNFKLLITPELRWRFFNFGPFLGDMWHLELTPFADIGNAWNSITDVRWDEIDVTFGLGLKVLWGEDFIVSFDYGMWPNGNRLEKGLYIGFDHQF